MALKKKVSDFQVIARCRLCNHDNLIPFLDMGNQPLANSFFKTRNEKSPLFPLCAQLCSNCGLIQLSGVVNRDLIFSTYSYRSSLSKTFQQHCSELAMEIARFVKAEKGRVLDIGSNDGCLLDAFKQRGFETIGVEPNRGFAAEARKKGIQTIADYWGPKVVQAVLKKGKVQVITATSVLAQVPEIHSFVRYCQQVLAPDGVMVVEVHYGARLIKKNEFDTIYHEHLSYFLLKPLIRLFEENGLKVIDASDSVSHAGALRLLIVQQDNPMPVRGSVGKLLEQEEKDALYAPATYSGFRQRVEKVRKKTRDFLVRQKKSGKKTVGFGAAAKACVLLNFFDLSPDLVSFVVDQTPEKQERFIGNTGIPIVDLPLLEKKPVDFLIIFSWNYAKEIMQKTAFLSGKRARFVLLIPAFRIVKGAEEL